MGRPNAEKERLQGLRADDGSWIGDSLPRLPAELFDTACGIGPKALCLNPGSRFVLNGLNGSSPR